MSVELDKIVLLVLLLVFPLFIVFENSPFTNTAKNLFLQVHMFHLPISVCGGPFNLEIISN